MEATETPEAPEMQPELAREIVPEVETQPAAEPTPEVVPTPEDGVVTGTSQDARSKNWVPYEGRFKPVLEGKRKAEAEAERYRAENERLRQEMLTRHNPQYAAQETVDDEDPYEMARKANQRVDQMEKMIRAEGTARRIHAEIDQQVAQLGYHDKDRARRMIIAEVTGAVQRGQDPPSIEEVARAIRQDEVDLEKSIANRYINRKTQPAAASAAPIPSSPPVVEPPLKREGGWKAATGRVMDALRGGG